MTRVQVVCVAAGFAGLLWAGVNVFADGWQFVTGAAVVAVALAVWNRVEARR